MTANNTPIQESNIQVKNSGSPLKIRRLQLYGICAENARDGDKVRILTRLALTSDDVQFHKIADSFGDLIEQRAKQSGHSIDLKGVQNILLVIHEDNSGDLWLDTAARSLEVVTRNAVKAGGGVFERDVADVKAISFPNVEINEQDRVICIFREGWRFGLFFDTNPEKKFSVAAMEKDLGRLYRRLKFSVLYDAIANTDTFNSLVRAGWFPFAELIRKEYQEIIKNCEEGWVLEEVELKLLDAFDAARMEKMFSRWMRKPHFANKQRILRSALNNYLSNDPVAVLKIILTEIEGILANAYQEAHGKKAKTKELLSFATQSAEQKSGQPDTLLFPMAFGGYLESYTFAQFDPLLQNGIAGSRHAVGHGAASEESYTQIRALQAMLTLDQLAFYI